MAQYGMTTQQHDAMDKKALDIYFRRVDERLRNYSGGIIVDAFSGGGRDILRAHDVLHGQGYFAAIDVDPQKIIDMLAKNKVKFDPYALRFDYVNSDQALTNAFNDNAIACIQGRFPDAPLGNFAEKSDIDLRADFMLCNAGIMFVRPEELKPTLFALSDMLNAGGEMALRFSLDREDKAEAKGKSYFVHGPELVQEILEEAGLTVTRHADLPDPAKRPFAWVDLQAMKI